jgi:hypothetical protein
MYTYSRESLEAQKECVRATANADRMLYPIQCRIFSLQQINLFSQREVATDHNLTYLSQNLIAIGKLLNEIIMVNWEPISLTILFRQFISCLNGNMN